MSDIPESWWKKWADATELDRQRGNNMDFDQQIDQDNIASLAGRVCSVCITLMGALGFLMFLAVYTGNPADLNKTIQENITITNEMTFSFGAISTLLIGIGLYVFFSLGKKDFPKTIRVLSEEPFPDPIISPIEFETPSAVINDSGPMSFEELMRKQKDEYYKNAGSGVAMFSPPSETKSAPEPAYTENDIATVNFFFEQGKQTQERLFNLPHVSYIAAQDINNLRIVRDRVEDTLAYKVGHTDPPKKGFKMPFGKKKSLWDTVDVAPKGMEPEGDKRLWDKIKRG